MSGVVEFYKDIMYRKQDPRTADWFLMSGPGPVVMILVCYIYFSVSAGPRYMRDRKPYELKNIMVIYNAIQIVLSFYVFVEGLNSGWLHYNLWCEPVNYSNTPEALKVAGLVHFYFICKLSELADTIIFVLRKNNRQITFLHLYHHSLMLFCAWLGARYFPGGHGTFLGPINSFVHVVMYTYYMLSSMGPHMQKYLWWKKYLTILQIVQFFLVLLHNLQALYYGCTYPKPLIILLCVNSSAFIYMFSSFYIRTYIKNNKTAASSKTMTSREKPELSCESITNGRIKVD